MPSVRGGDPRSALEEGAGAVRLAVEVEEDAYQEQEVGVLGGVGGGLGQGVQMGRLGREVLAVKVGDAEVGIGPVGVNLQALRYSTDPEFNTHESGLGLRLGREFGNYLAVEGHVGIGLDNDTSAGVEVGIDYLAGIYLRGNMFLWDPRARLYGLVGVTHGKTTSEAFGLSDTTTDKDRSLPASMPCPASTFLTINLASGESDLPTTFGLVGSQTSVRLLANKGLVHKTDIYFSIKHFSGKLDGIDFLALGVQHRNYHCHHSLTASAPL